MRMKDIIVTAHALGRWHQRFAIYGDDPAWRVQKAVKRSRPITDSETSGVFDSVRRRMFVDDQTGAVFVIRQEADLFVVITVMTLEQAKIPKGKRGARLP